MEDNSFETVRCIGLIFSHTDICNCYILFRYSESTGEALAVINLSQQECFITMTLKDYC